MGRRRAKKGLEPNLYESKGYFRYRHPITKKESGMGGNKAKANAAARILNARLIKEPDLVKKVIDAGKAPATFEIVIDRYNKEFLPSKELEKTTLNAEIGRLNRIKLDKGAAILSDQTVRDCADYLDSNYEKNPYVKYRSTLKAIFDFAKRKGLFEGENPVDATEKKAKQGNKKERQRMTLKQYQALHEAAPEWLKNAMDFSILSLQGLSEVVSAKFENYDEENRTIRVIRKKNSKHEWAFLEIEVSDDLHKIIQRCRKSNIASPFLIHHKPERRNPDNSKEHWSQILPNYLGSELRKIRDSLDIFESIPESQRPAFHEIRALGSHLYEKSGYSDADYVQPLMAHSDVKMTRHYQKGHEVKWNRVKAELLLDTVHKNKMGE